jgi:hypothetical protein
MPAIALGALILLGIFAFRTTFSLGPTGAATLNDATFIAILLIDGNIGIPVPHAIVRFNSPEFIKIQSSGREINTTGNLWLDNFDGTIRWNGEHLLAEGTMDSAHGAGLDITWPRRERTTILLNNGVADVAAMNLSSFKREATGRVTLENRWTARLNETPFSISNFDGRVYLQRINNETALVFEGRAALNIGAENLLKIIT